jgi:general secretion pathway protein G
MEDIERAVFVKRIFASQGFTLLETMMVLAIIGILAAIAVPNFLHQREQAKIAVAIADIKNIAQKVLEFYDEEKAFPAALADIGLDELRDPWGNAYDYWPITGDNRQKVRKDRNTHPINTDFDLCSKGRDGKTNYPLTAKNSHDDIIRANNGGYIGLASNY